MLQAQNVIIEFDVLRALGPVSFAIEAGQFVSLVGPSGCGKSTLIRAIAGLQSLTSGTLTLAGEIIRKPLPRIGLMFQQANLMPWRTVTDNIALPLEIAGHPRNARYEVVAQLLPLLGLDGFSQALPSQLSGGMAQRTALGRVLVQKPDVLLLDEPFGALDALTREKISLDLLKIWEQQGQMVLMVTHDIHEAVLLSDHVFVMSPRPGQIIADIPVDLPRPRTIETTYETRFAEITRQVRQVLDVG